MTDTKRILLVSPYIPSDVRAWWIPGGDGPAMDVPGTLVPLGLATVAGLTPDRFKVDIWDECIKGMIDEHTELDHEYDIVGFTGYLPHLRRVKDIIPVFRNRGIFTVVGGPGVSSAPHLMTHRADVVFVGEVERTWVQFLEDWEAGKWQAMYKQIEKIELDTSPKPDWSSIADDIPLYANGCVQTTRGCPFDCEFCDVVYLYGRRQRHKDIDQILEEIAELERLGTEAIFICDDEFAGHPKYSKELLRRLIPLNNSFKRPLRFRTQITLNVGKDDEFMELLADANFDLLVMGIETPNKESLKETSKTHNLREDMVGAVKHVLSYGVGIRSGIIVGFDHDGPDIFDMQFNFIQDACLPLVTIGMLKAPLGTRLWSRMSREGRMLNWMKVTEKTSKPNRMTNIVPKLMTRTELMRGMLELQSNIHDWKNFAERMKGFVSNVKREPQVKDDPMPYEELLTLGDRLGVEPEGKEAIRDIFEHVHKTAPFMWRKVRSYIGSLAIYRRTFPVVVKALEEQIRGEESGEIKVELEERSLDVPPVFRENFQAQDLPGDLRAHLPEPEKPGQHRRSVDRDIRRLPGRLGHPDG